jgi:uncharacterized protein (DUF488 family)
MLYTAGYEGLTAGDFWSSIQANGIEKIIDVRGNPFSRKPGFSKTPLSVEAARQNVGYEHWRVFGCPREILLDYRVNHDWELYSERFWAYIRQQEAEVLRLARLSLDCPVCLICFERDPNFCHRSYVAAFANELVPEVQVNHLTLERGTRLPLEQ